MLSTDAGHCYPQQLTMTIPLHKDEDGVYRVAQTRVTLDSVIYAFKDGTSAEDVFVQYPSLDLSDIYLLIAYYLKHTEEIEAYLREREQVCDEIRCVNEQRAAPRLSRRDLLARAAKLTPEDVSRP
jgi:uncharacterized protein (DUF433 family)